MNFRQLIFLLLLGAALAAHAGDIDLQCEALAVKLIGRLTDEGLLTTTGKDAQPRARAIVVELCTGTQATAEQQHEAAEKQSLDNWFFKNSSDKPGNIRLKNLKR
jgi:hypothetical protein